MKQTPSMLSVRIFRNVTRFWFITTWLGQLAFVYYILMMYYRSLLQSNPERWNTVNSHFYIKGDITGNLVFGLHVVLAAIVTILGPLQLVGWVRKKVPRLHRVSGRIYLITAVLISAAGLYLTWVRGAVGGPFSSVAITINGLLILVCATFTIKYAVQRNIKVHNQWAVHLFVAMSGVWFFRVFFMLWMVIHRAPVGFEPKTFTGPFLNFLGVFVYIFPQIIVAWYFKSRFSDSATNKWLFSFVLLLLTLGTAIGTFGAVMGMWLPRI
ncbi:DUF2306 domain-containing protein [Paraflavitalea sp. CAU 1676]|uniref:DUF2306 domain-containing protein n=1 Tax=Paraflavitalea sp. CAU 1676 TaxID=3032598 RepID=UPI0023DB01B3|nr:DUF2306 domain-containing protein [Paraflavitalea sp. CAU 1676]MDF2189700.1 DUF2306 domain-containing protein [Paraflavitalea sp. CAU 1676]